MPYIILDLKLILPTRQSDIGVLDSLFLPNLTVMVNVNVNWTHKFERHSNTYWFSLFCRRLPELRVPNLTSWMGSTISSSEVPTPFGMGARAKELESSGALVERPLGRVLPLPGPGMMEEAHWDISIIWSLRKNIWFSVRNIRAPSQTSISRFGD